MSSEELPSFLNFDLYVPKIFKTKNPPSSSPSSKIYKDEKTDVVFHVDKRSTYREMSVCPCFEDEPFYPAVVSYFDCLNRTYGEKSKCVTEEMTFKEAVRASLSKE